MTKPLKCIIPAGFAHEKPTGRAEYLRATIIHDRDGRNPLHGRKGESDFIANWADGLVEIPLDNAGVEPGMPLAFLPFADRAL